MRGYYMKGMFKKLSLVLVVSGVVCVLASCRRDGEAEKVEDSVIPSANLMEGLIGYYSFDEKAMDESESGNHGEVNGANREKDVNGNRNGSYRWNSGRDNIKLPIDINIGALPEVSLCAWVYPLSSRNGIVVVSNDDGGGDRKIHSVMSGNQQVWACSDGKGGFIGAIPKVNNKWVFLVATYSEKTRRASIYVDGVGTSGGTSMDMGSSTTLLGANPSGNKKFEALIDEVRIYDRILTRSEIYSLRKLKPFINNNEEDVEDAYFYRVSQDNLIVRSEPLIGAPTIGNLAKGDVLNFEERVPSKGGASQFNEWLKIEIDGKPGYVGLKYLDHTNRVDENMSRFETAMDDFVDWGKWQFWVAMVVLLIIGFAGSFAFEHIDGLLAAITGSDYEGNLAFFPIMTALTGVVMAILIVIWQDGIEYYIGENFTIWPSGYGFSAWAVWVLLLSNLIVFSILVFESLSCGNLIHAVLRVVLQLVLAAITFITSLIVTIALILIVIVVAIVGIFLSAAFCRTVYTDRWGNKYVE